MAGAYSGVRVLARGFARATGTVWQTEVAPGCTQPKHWKRAVFEFALIESEILAHDRLAGVPDGGDQSVGEWPPARTSRKYARILNFLRSCRGFRTAHGPRDAVFRRWAWRAAPKSGINAALTSSISGRRMVTVGELMMEMSHAETSWDVVQESGARLSGWPEAALKVKQWDFPGFGPMTRVDTMSGPFPAQALRVGDRVRTRRGAFAEIRWVDRVVLDEEFLHHHPEAQPVLIPARSLGRGLPANDVVLSPGQKVNLDGLLMPKSSCVASELVRAHGSRRKIETVFTYTMFLCAKPEEVKMEGLWVKLEPPHW